MRPRLPPGKRTPYRRPTHPTAHGNRPSPATERLRGQWWDLYGDPQLSALEAKVAVSNQTLRAAMEQYFQAREQVRVARSQYYPTLAAGPSIGRTRESNNQPNTVKGISDYQFNTFSIAGQAQWEPDLWGQVRRTVEQTRANAQASAALLASVELSVRAELAVDYFQLRGLDSPKGVAPITPSSPTRTICN